MSARSDGRDVVKFLKARESMGTRVSSKDPFPPNPGEWLPATSHPPGYSVLLALLYEICNYTAMLRWVLRIQIILDSLTCILVYVFIKNLFGHRSGLIATWIYALLPAPIILCLQVLPDSLSCFFAAAILASGSYIRTRGLRAAVATGSVIGLASLFRAEFVMWSAIVILLVCVSRATLISKLRWSGALVCCQVAVLSPWMMWTYRATGHPLLTTSGSGACMYASLGEIPNNPWQVTLDDGWVGDDARRRGLSSAWTPEADAYYHRMFLSCVRMHPESFVHLLLTQRLPLALAPGYSFEGNLWFATNRLNEGLTRWQAVRKYPSAAIRHEWLKLVMALLSAFLLATMLSTCFVYRHALRAVAWLWIPCIVTATTVAIIKQVEARNLACNLIPEVGATALLASRVHWRWNRHTRDYGAPDTYSAMLER
jgi:4-amino-4-deoxy-L-arabinose transferase-like glycosyltransferase